MPNIHTGLYCLTNDAVLEWTIALLESVRIHEPERVTVLIPFDDRTEAIRSLVQRYNVQLFEDNSVLRELDRIGTRFSNQHFHVRVFRKFAAFWGPLDHFVFVDSDVVLLGSLQEIFDEYRASGAEFVGNDPDVNQVYKAGPFRDQMMSNTGAEAFNGGFFVASKNLFSLEEVDRLSIEAEPINQWFSDVGGEQPFLNYCVHARGLKYKSIGDLVPDTSVWTWAKQRVRKAGKIYRLGKNGGPEDGKRLPYLHWSGIACNPGMPNRRIFLRYRLHRMPWHARLRYRFGALIQWWQKYWKPKISRKLSSVLNGRLHRRVAA